MNELEPPHLPRTQYLHRGLTVGISVARRRRVYVQNLLGLNPKRPTLALHTAALALRTNPLVMAKNLAAGSRSGAADVEAALAAIADDYLAFNLRPAANTTSARGAASVVDIAGAGVVLCTREFRRAS